MTKLLDYFDVSLTNSGGFPRILCELDALRLENAATALAEAVAVRRIGVNPRLHDLWMSHRDGLSTDHVETTDLELLKASLLQNIGTPIEPTDDRHLHGLVAEALWFEVMSDVDAGLGLPMRVEGHDWSVTDPGGDGLTIYKTSDGFCFRLWESKHHGTADTVRKTANLASRQLRDRSLSYLSRFSLIAQDLTADAQLASFYGLLPELWVNKDAAAGVGINVSAGVGADTDGDFDNVSSYFDLGPGQHQAALHLVGDVVVFCETVRKEIWKGCGLWTEP